MILPNDLAELESDELRPWISINGVETSLGIYQAATVSNKGSSSGTRVEIEAYDRCWRVYTQKTETLLHLAAGASYLTGIRTYSDRSRRRTFRRPPWLSRRGCIPCPR